MCKLNTLLDLTKNLLFYFLNDQGVAMLLSTQVAAFRLLIWSGGDLSFKHYF